jgi:hypothetical protein
MHLLEDKSKAPKHVRQREITAEEKLRVIALRKKWIRYGKMKLAINGKFAYAKMYKSKSSLNGKDFLYRLHYLLDGQIPRAGHDNGTEFEKYFKEACEDLKIEQYYSRVRTPKDNPECERFNQTLQNEFINLGNFNSEPEVFNRNLTEWLVEYNFYRPHESLGYQAPIEFSKVLPMYSSCTIA